MTTLESIAEIVMKEDFDYAIPIVLGAKRCFVLEHSCQDLALMPNGLVKYYYCENNTISVQPVFDSELVDIFDCLKEYCIVADCFMPAQYFESHKLPINSTMIEIGTLAFKSITAAKEFYKDSITEMYHCEIIVNPKDCNVFANDYENNDMFLTSMRYYPFSPYKKYKHVQVPNE